MHTRLGRLLWCLGLFGTGVALFPVASPMATQRLKGRELPVARLALEHAGVSVVALVVGWLIDVDLSGHAAIDGASSHKKLPTKEMDINI